MYSLPYEQKGIIIIINFIKNNKHDNTSLFLLLNGYVMIHPIESQMSQSKHWTLQDLGNPHNKLLKAIPLPGQEVISAILFT